MDVSITEVIIISFRRIRISYNAKPKFPREIAILGAGCLSGMTPEPGHDVRRARSWIWCSIPGAAVRHLILSCSTVPERCSRGQDEEKVMVGLIAARWLEGRDENPGIAVIAQGSRHLRRILLPGYIGFPSLLRNAIQCLAGFFL